MKRLLSLAIGAAAFCTGASGAVTGIAPNGFTVEIKTAIAAPPGKVFAALAAPARWWSPDHTFSGNAANLSLALKAGGCFCEKFPGGGGVQHLSVLSVMPGKMLRLSGMLGPFQNVAGNGVMTWTLAPYKDGTRLALTYQVAGYARMAMNGKGYDYWSKAADGMLSQQVTRLKRLVENGRPAP
jgi:uncharacterized protein YndB with AHSA1/START domain